MKLFLNALLILGCALTSVVYAADECSADYIGKATLNEVFVKHQGGGQSRVYLEVKLLDGSLTAEYDNWKVKICTQNSCSTLSLSSANDNNLPWIYFDKDDFDINLIDFDNGFDLSLLDASDNFIDYISVEKVDRQNFGVFCKVDDLPYDFPIPDTETGTKLLHRTPDGVGSWTALSANNGETPGSGNTDPTNNPLLTISDDSVMQGDNENFTISIQDYFGNPAYSLNDIEIVYYTTNDSATSPEHYIGIGNTAITIPAGFNSVTIPIETVFVGDQVTRRFYLQYTADVFIIDNLGVGTIIPGAVSGPLGLYRFEQTDLSSQIDDTSGNNNHAEITYLGASAADGKYCRGFDSGGWNDQDYTATSFRSSLDLNDDVGVQGTISFWFNSTIDWHQGQERVLFDASIGDSISDKYFVFEIQEDGRLKFAFEDSSDDDFTVLEPLSTRVANTWYYLTVTWDYTNDSFAIYVDGALQQQDTRNTNGAMGELNQIVFGDNSSEYTEAGNSNIASPVSSRGNFDEVRIYNKVLTQAEIQTDMNDNHGCAVIDHFQIDTKDQQGITCQADEITIKACADASCSIINSDAVDVKLLINDVEYKTVTVSGSEGTTTTYPYTTVGNAALSLDQAYECEDSSTTPCYVDFSDAGFVFSSIDDQVAGIDFSGLTIQAVKDIDGVCTDLLSGSKTVEMAMEYIAPSRTTTNNYSLSGTDIAKNLFGSVNDYSPVGLNFVANATADLGTNKYDDAGQVKLYARYVEPPSGGEPGFSIEGESNSFWVSPHHFSVSATNGSITLDNTTTTSPTVKKQVAGDAFSLSFIAENANGDATTNYVAQQAQLQLERTGPTTGGSEGSLKYSSNQSISSQLSGSLTYSNATEVVFDLTGEYNFNAASYSEVGLTQLSIRDDNYGAGNYKPEGVANIGRFTPAYFTQSVESHGSLNAHHYDTCSPVTNHWAYAGQTRDRSGSTVGAISYTDYLAPIINITAYNSDNEITKNYTETGFMKLSASGITIPVPIGDDEAARLFPDVANENVIISASMIAGGDPIPSGTAGIVTYTFNELDHFVYEHNKHSKLKAFPAKIPFTVTGIADDDLITLYTGGDSSITVTEKVITSGVEIRFGRWLLENSYGPETSPLPVTMFTQYFDGNDYDDTNFIKNEEESCLVPSIGSKVTSGDIGDTGLNLWDYRLVDLDSSDSLLPTDTNASYTVPTNAFDAGLYQWLIFSAPSAVGPNKQGALKVEYQVPPWLQYDWDSDSNFINNPTATLTFGIYRGNDRIIYQREIEKIN